SGSGGPELLVARLVVPACVTSEKITGTGVVPVVESTGSTTTFVPTGVGLPAGVYNSALASAVPDVSMPPVTRTWPLPRSVAACRPRALLMLPAEDQVSAVGSYSSVALLAQQLLPLSMPTSRIWPLVRVVAVL